MDIRLVINRRREKKGTTHATMMLTLPLLDWEESSVRRADNFSTAITALNRSACDTNCINGEYVFNIMQEFSGRACQHQYSFHIFIGGFKYPGSA